MRNLVSGASDWEGSSFGQLACSGDRKSTRRSSAVRQKGTVGPMYPSDIQAPKVGPHRYFHIDLSRLVASLSAPPKRESRSSAICYLLLSGPTFIPF